ncbi:MAG TPA: hypothetical protein VFV86_03065 [Nitrososphaeraceae archaeon]|nr:hypothetical protein [Nitrososphaeraceae archaeon]
MSQEKSVFLLSALVRNPLIYIQTKPEFRDDEICGNDKDDDKDGSVDEFPCTVVSGKFKLLPPNNPILTPEKSK